VVLVPVTLILWMAGRSLGWAKAMPNAHAFLWTLLFINLGLLIFNLLPIYPLDGGQILRSLLWFVLGRARSLMVATIIGFVGVAGLVVFAVWMKSAWIGILCAFILMNCWGGLQQALALLRMAKVPRREGFACPSCKAPPPVGSFWTCSRCRQPFDTFQTQAVCPHCSAQFAATRCVDCGRLYAMSEWIVPAGLQPHQAAQPDSMWTI